MEKHASAALIWLLGCRRTGEELLGGAPGPGFTWNLTTGIGQLDGVAELRSVQSVFRHFCNGDDGRANAAAERFVSAITPVARNTGAWFESIPPRNQRIPDHFEEAERTGRALRYTLEEGETAFFVLDGQTHTFGNRTNDRHKAWRAQGQGRLILSGLQRLRGLPEAPVVLVPKAGAVEPLQTLMREAVVCTWHGGLAHAADLDLTPLTGRHVIVWPGSDDALHAATSLIADRLRGMARTVQWIGQPAAWVALDRPESLDSASVETWHLTADGISSEAPARPPVERQKDETAPAIHRLYRGRQLSAPEAAALEPDKPRLSVPEARRQLSEQLEAFLVATAAGSNTRAEGLLLRATTGLGKTSGLLRTLKLLRDHHGIDLVRQLPVCGTDADEPEVKRHVVAYLAPTRELAEETRQEAINQGLRPFRVRSRLEDSENGPPMCAKRDLVSELYDAGLGRQVHRLCRETDPTTQEEVKCEFYDTCPYIRQSEELEAAVDAQRIDLVISTHKRVLLGLPKGIPPWLTVLDERVDAEFPNVLSVSLEHLSTSLPGDDMQDDVVAWKTRDKLAGELAIKLYNGGDITTAAASYADEKNLKRLYCLDRALKAEAQAGIDLGPDTNVQQIAEVTARAKAAAVLRAERTMWKMIRERAEEILQQAPLFQQNGDAQVVFQADPRLVVRAGQRDGTGKAIVIRTRKEPGKAFRESPLLALDATGDAALLERCFRAHRWRTCEIRSEEPQLELVGVPDVTVSNAAVNVAAAPTEAARASAERLIDDLRAEIEVVGVKHGELVVIATRAVRQALFGDGVWQAPANVTFAGFADQRGLNKFADADGFFVIGRIQPGLRDVEDYIAAYYGDEPWRAEQIELDYDQLPKKLGYWRVKTGEIFTKNVPQAPNELAAAILFQFREANILQAIGRARGVGRSSPATVYVRTSIPVPVTWDRVMTAYELRGGRCQLSGAFHRLEGVLPLTPSILAAVLKDVFGENQGTDACRKQLAPVCYTETPHEVASSLSAITPQPAIVEASWYGKHGPACRFLVDGSAGVGAAEEHCRRVLQGRGYDVRRCDLTWRALESEGGYLDDDLGDRHDFEGVTASELMGADVET